MRRYSAIMGGKDVNPDFLQYHFIMSYFPHDVCEEIRVCKVRNEARDFTKRASFHSDFLVVCGSNFLLKEVIMGLSFVSKDIPILFVPIDFSNFLAQPLGYKEPLMNYINDALENSPIMYPIYEVNEHILNLASLESDYVLKNAFLMFSLSYSEYLPILLNEKDFKKNLYLNMRRALKSFKSPVDIYLDGALLEEEHTGFYLLNPYLWNQSHSKDLEVVVTKKIDNFVMIKEIMEYLNQKRTLEELSFVSLYKASHVLLKSNKPFDNLMVDGERTFKYSKIVEIKPVSLVRMMTSKK